MRKGHFAKTTQSFHGNDWIHVGGGRPPYAFIWCDVYRFGFIVQWDTNEEDAQRLFSTLNPKEKDTKVELSSGGGKYVYVDRRSHIFLAKGCGLRNSVPHEAMHLAHNEICEIRGVNSEEAMAYMVGWITQKIYDAIAVSRKKSCIRRANRHRSNPNRKKP